jgi:hypothetical protein
VQAQCQSGPDSESVVFYIFTFWWVESAGSSLAVGVEIEKMELVANPGSIAGEVVSENRFASDRVLIF